MSNTVMNENMTALRNALTASVSGKLMEAFLGKDYSALDAVMLASSSTAIAANSEPDTLRGSFLRLVSKALCINAADKITDVAYKIITPAGEISDPDTRANVQKELESVFANVKKDIEDVTADVMRFSTQGERTLVGSVTEADNDGKAVVLEKGTGSSTHINIPAGHILCDRCKMPGKKTKSRVLDLKRPELMPDELVALNGKMLCPKCLAWANGVIQTAIKNEEQRIKEAEAKAKAEADAAKAEEEKKKDLEMLEALKAEEAKLTKELAELEAAIDVVPDSIKEITKTKAEECRLSVQSVRTKIAELNGRLNPAIPMGPAKPVAPSVAHTTTRVMTKAERKALRRANAGK